MSGHGGALAQSTSKECHITHRVTRGGDGELDRNWITARPAVIDQLDGDVSALVESGLQVSEDIG